ncbi:DUF2076 family protein [Ensifer aridi]|uniref:DUF2076 family protein n=1 Tax=Ensifer aridi TaxID=1708715 RepID=UPI0009BE32CE|nr:DUF2076 family protein [Ensifer aridi]
MDYNDRQAIEDLFGKLDDVQRQAAPRDGEAGPWNRQSGALGQGARGSGFLAGAAQTAMGVAGGVLLGNAIAGMLGGSEANAVETSEPRDQENDGGDSGDFGDSEL